MLRLLLALLMSMAWCQPGYADASRAPFELPDQVARLLREAKLPPEALGV
ncbi:MAG: hypothetical protein H7203_02855, partial [Rhizobacter sp.]|nr:hypothetical protein [Burkholderiales bacterium]